MEQKKILQDVHSVDTKTGFPQETFSDSMTIPKKVFRVEWRPNNYRRQLKVKIKSDSTLNVLSRYFGGKCIIGKRNKVFTTKHFIDGLTLQYGRNTLVAMYPQRYVDGEKEVFVIEHKDLMVCEDWIINKRKEIMRSLDVCLFDFAKKFNIISIGEKPIWSRHEDWIIDDEIRKLPEWEIIHGDNIKKVYPKGLEFVGGKGVEPTVMILNRIRNEALKRFAPDIHDGLNSILDHLNRKDALVFLKNNVSCAADVLRFKDYVLLLSSAEKHEFCNFMFDKLGVS